MGNTGSRRVHGRRRISSGLSRLPPAPVAQPEIGANSYVFAAPQPPSQDPNPNIPPPAGMRVPMPAVPTANWANGSYSSGVRMQPSQPYVEHQKAITIRNDVNLKKETLRIEPDEENPGKFLVEFTFDATVAGSITTVFFAKEGEDCHLIPTKESLLPPITVHFQPGLAQKFKQSSGTGIDISMLNEAESLNNIDEDVYPLAVKAEASPNNQAENPIGGSMNSQITQALIRKEKGEYLVRVVKQVLWVNGTNYELQEIYGIGNSLEDDFDENDPAKECVICLLEPCDTTVLPCRHMCMCSSCAKVLRIRTNKCPICRQPFERLLEIKLTDETKEQRELADTASVL